MWILLAGLSAFFAGITAVLAKFGVKDVDSDVATALRTVVVLLFSLLMVALGGDFLSLAEIRAKTWLFLILSGLATGVSWLCYFKALQLGDVAKVAAVDKSSTLLTMLLAVIFLHEPLTHFGVLAMIFIGVGTFLMIGKGGAAPARGKRGWLFYAALSAFAASLVAILAKIGMQDIPSSLGTAIRTAVVLLFAFGIVFAKGEGKKIRRIKKRSLLFLILSGLTTGASWLCYFRALQVGRASVVVPIDKLSILVTALFSVLFCKERLSRRAVLGLLLLVGGTLLLLC